MRVVIWNMAGASPSISASRRDEAWQYLFSLKPDLALLQEAIIPDAIKENWNVAWNPAYTRRRWGSAILTSFPILERFDLGSLEPDLSPLLEAFGGQIVGAKLSPTPGQSLIAISVHTPARTVPITDIPPSLLSGIKLQQNRYVWRADVVFGAVRHLPRLGLPFLFGGDWNTSRLFDQKYGPRGNDEFFNRMGDAGAVDCLRKFHPAEVRTWYRRGDGHYQLDHLFCDVMLVNKLSACSAYPEPAEILGLSDHAPIVADFNN